MDNRKISVCIPNWNRFEMPVKAVEQVIDDERIGEIVFVDDCSTNGDDILLENYFKHNKKVKFFKNESNLDCYRNKRQAILKASNEWCILFDSDNVLSPHYIDALYAIPDWENKTIYQPSFGRPHFDFRQYSGRTFNRNNIYDTLTSEANRVLETALNAMNFFINRAEYLDAWDGTIDPFTSDSIYFNYCWLAKGNNYYVTPNLEYDHLVHVGHYQLNVHKTGDFHNQVLNKFAIINQII